MKAYKIIVLILTFVSACAPSTQQPTVTVPPVTATEESSEAPEPTFTTTSTQTATSEPTLTLTPTIELSPAITSTPTFTFPGVTVNKQAHCRYGPSVAYLHAADLYPAGDAAPCAAGLFTVTGCISSSIS